MGTTTNRFEFVACIVKRLRYIEPRHTTLLWTVRMLLRTDIYDLEGGRTQSDRRMQAGEGHIDPARVFQSEPRMKRFYHCARWACRRYQPLDP